jgi:hypothetical protein
VLADLRWAQTINEQVGRVTSPGIVSAGTVSTEEICMGYEQGRYPPVSESSSSNRPAATDVARDQAREVGQSAKQASGQVAQTATDQARLVMSEARQQTRDLLGEARSQAREQAHTQQQKAVGGLRQLGDELSKMCKMTQASGQSGIASELAQQASDRAHGIATWLEQHEPAGLVDEVRNFARRQPGTFLIGAALAGVVVGRLTRGVMAPESDNTGTGGPAALPAPTSESAMPLAGSAAVDGEGITSEFASREEVAAVRPASISRPTGSERSQEYAGGGSDPISPSEGRTP